MSATSGGSFTWGGLSEDKAGLDEQVPPPDAVTGHSVVEIIGYERRDIGPQDGDGPAVVSTVLTERFTGAIEGMGYADHLRVLNPDGSGIATGVERVIGSVDGRTGSFALTSHATNVDAGTVRGVWTVVPGSATGELIGLRGRGEFTAQQRPDGSWRAEDAFASWYEPPD